MSSRPASAERPVKSESQFCAIVTGVMGMATARIPGNVSINSVLFPLPRHFVDRFGIYVARLLGNNVACVLLRGV